MTFGIQRGPSMKKSIAVCLLLLSVLLHSRILAPAQETQEQTPPSAMTDVQQKNLQEYIALLRSDVRQQKDEIMGAVMALNVDQAAKFWPIYEEYDAELTKLNNLRVANIQDYAGNYDQMTDAKADESVQNAFNYRKQRSALLEKYYGRVKASLGSIEAARFLQIEDQLLAIIDLQITSNLPIVGQGY
jgi:flagellar biosynthesis chaperone FliJ